MGGGRSAQCERADRIRVAAGGGEKKGPGEGQIAHAAMRARCRTPVESLAAAAPAQPIKRKGSRASQYQRGQAGEVHKNRRPRQQRGRGHSECVQNVGKVIRASHSMRRPNRSILYCTFALRRSNAEESIALQPMARSPLEASQDTRGANSAMLGLYRGNLEPQSQYLRPQP
jgi:hypothetical protein